MKYVAAIVFTTFLVAGCSSGDDNKSPYSLEFKDRRAYKSNIDEHNQVRMNKKFKTVEFKLFLRGGFIDSCMASNNFFHTRIEDEINACTVTTSFECLGSAVAQNNEPRTASILIGAVDSNRNNPTHLSPYLRTIKPPPDDKWNCLYERYIIPESIKGLEINSMGDLEVLPGAEFEFHIGSFSGVLKRCESSSRPIATTIELINAVCVIKGRWSAGYRPGDGFRFIIRDLKDIRDDRAETFEFRMITLCPVGTELTNAGTADAICT